MTELEKITTEKQASETTIINNNFEKLDIKAIEKYLKNISFENYEHYNKGKVYQKNKELNLVQYFFKLLMQEINKESTNNESDINNIVISRLNKKMVVDNLSGLNSVLSNFNLNNEKILYILLGTIIQYIYELEEK